MAKLSLDGSNRFYLHDVVAVKKITAATDEIHDSEAASSRTNDDLYITDMITNAVKTMRIPKVHNPASPTTPRAVKMHC